MEASTLVLVHPDPAVIPDDGGVFAHLGYPLVVHRDPSASVPDLIDPGTAGVLFAAQMDSDLPQQICEIAVGEACEASYPLIFWGPGTTHAILDQLLRSGATDCFRMDMAAGEAAIRFGHHVRASGRESPGHGPSELVQLYNKQVRTLAHDLKNPLCVLYGYAQMAQMGHPIALDEAEDMVEAARSIRDQIDSALAKKPILEELGDLQARTGT